MPMTAAELVSDVAELVALPDVCFQVNEMVEDPYCSAVELAEVIGQDPSLTAQLLRIANSPYYGFPSHVSTITRAIAIVGTRDLAELVLATSVVNTFSDYPSSVIDIDEFWHHSFMTAMMARSLASHTRTPILHKERLFVSGLLHDIGRLVMGMRIEELVKVMHVRTQERVEPLPEVERLVFNLDHTQVGEELMKSWHLPEGLQKVARYHHEPEQADSYQLEVALVHIASQVVAAEQNNVLLLDSDDIRQSMAWEITGLSEEAVESALMEAVAEYLGIASAFLGSPSSGKRKIR